MRQYSHPLKKDFQQLCSIYLQKKKKKGPGHCGADQKGENMIAFAK